MPAPLARAVGELRVGEAHDAVRVAGRGEVDKLAHADLLVPVAVELDGRACAAADAADAQDTHGRVALEHAHADHSIVPDPGVDGRVDLRGNAETRQCQSAMSMCRRTQSVSV